MRGAPQPGLLRLSIRIRSRISCGTFGRPGLPRRIRQVQNKRKPLRCQVMPVSALTIIRAALQSPHTRRSHTQKIQTTQDSNNHKKTKQHNTNKSNQKTKISKRSWAEVLNIEVRTSS